MKRIIEVEETLKLRHQIFVEIDSEEDLECAIEGVPNRCSSLDDYVRAIESRVHVVEVNEEYYGETDSIEYYDDYLDDEE